MRTEQQRIVAKVDELLRWCVALAALLPAILDRAFKGEL